LAPWRLGGAFLIHNPEPSSQRLPWVEELVRASASVIIRSMNSGSNRPPRLSRRRFLQGSLAAAVATSLRNVPIATAQVAPRRPNIVFLLTDDQRADSLSCAGNTILKTPNIDALAAGGVRFQNAFATDAICMSSRASILTGLYTRVHHIIDFSRPLARPLFDRSYPILLRKAGYRTGFVGKWGLGGDLPRGDYDSFAGYSGQGMYFEPGRTKHLTVLQGEQSVEFLRGCRKDQPFCLAVSFKAPHVQDEGRDQPGIYAKYPYDRALDGLFQNDVVARPRTVDAAPLPAFFDLTINRTREGPDFFPANYQETMKDLYRLLTGVDQAVGVISAALRDLGLDDNTVIIYNSDHGSFYGEHGFGGKWLMNEESIRSPLIVHDPRLDASQKGTLRDQMVLNVDIAPTLLALAQVPIPIGMQGRSLVPLIHGEKPSWRTDWFYEHLLRGEKPYIMAASEGVRNVDWKYIRYIDENPVYEQLFDLRNDPREERNLAAVPEHAETLSGLRSRWSTWRTELEHFDPTNRWSDPV
jgi:arylsulfatase A-like enzyme